MTRGSSHDTTNTPLRVTTLVPRIPPLMDTTIVLSPGTTTTSVPATFMTAPVIPVTDRSKDVASVIVD